VTRTTPRREARVLRRTRVRLLLWSGGSTLLVLTLLSVALYVAVSRQLAADAEEQLRSRAEIILLGGITREAPFPPPDTGQPEVGVAAGPGDPGLAFGGPESGTIALIIGPGDVVAGGPAAIGPAPERTSVPGPHPATGDRVVAISPDPIGVASARAGREMLSETHIAGTPVRVLSVPLIVDGETYVVQVLSDRSPELRALAALLAVLSVGGVLVIAAALGLGWLYAGRALRPIRDSLARQREFAADASHELRTPLTVIRSNLEILRPEARDRPTAATALADAEAEAARMGDLVDDLLLLARTDADALELEETELELGDEVAEALSPLSAVAEARGIRLTLDAAPTRAVGDRVRLRQVATILVDNAIQHARSTVTVTVRPAAGGGSELLVDDDGPGIPLEHREKVFERFWRAPDARRGGSGLGLAIARWIAERHEGTLRVADASGSGARFEMRLPPA
jgi:two-component system, OmpR family, sensor histidine kinase CiaH